MSTFQNCFLLSFYDQLNEYCKPLGLRVYFDTGTRIDNHTKTISMNDRKNREVYFRRQDSMIAVVVVAVVIFKPYVSMLVAKIISMFG